MLLTGEPGVGKTWVCRKLSRLMPASWHWATIDLSPAIDEGECLRLILHALGHDPARGPADARAALRDILADGSDDGRPWGLFIEEAHNASAGVLEELRVLGNRMGAPEVFGAMVLVGQNALARRMTTRSLAAFQARLSVKVHLRPLDVKELRSWVDEIEHGRARDDDAIERLHRETLGNPRKVLTVEERGSFPGLAAIAPGPRSGPLPRAVTDSRPEPAAATRIPDCETPPVAPGKPPLRVGEGMIEVGWEPTANPVREPEPGLGMLARPFTVASAGGAPSARKSDGAAASEVIDDHYAALQAWTEWAQNQGREPVPVTAAHEDGDTAPPVDFATHDDPEDDPSERLSGLAGVRAEGQHDFGPYSQLFTKLRQPRDR